MRLLVVMALICLLGTTQAGQWPQFRGPDGQGHASASDLPITFGEQENLAWKVPLAGRGWSSPVIWDRQIWLTTATDEGRSLRAICVQEDTGEILHNVEVFRVPQPPTINPKNSYASPTAVIDTQGQRVFVHFGTLGTACLDTSTAKVVWTNQELKLDHKEGPGSSPILWRNLFIVNCDGMDVQYVVALDQQTGKVVWKQERPGPLPDNPDYRKAYSTPLIVDVQGQELLISTGADQAIAYEPASGRPAWRLRYQGFSNVPRPIYGHGVLFICTGYMKPQLWAVRLNPREVSEKDILWRCARQVPANSSPILVNDRIYMTSDQGILTCLDAETGREIWKERLGGGFSASPILADGKLYFSSEEGVVSVIQPADSYELLASNQLDGRIMASPAAVGRGFYLRTDTHLYRFEKGAGRTANRAR
jgi:outer membrane protein assembly factor BamB